MALSLIVAFANHGVIGRDGQMPWRQSADLRQFKRLTMGHCLIMGRKTFASLGRALPGRTSIVLSRNAELALPAGVLRAPDFAAALRMCGDDPEPFAIGGGEIYRLALPHATKLYITRIEAELSGDTYFPAVDFSAWRLVEECRRPADATNEHAYRFETWIRATGGPL